MRQDQFDQLSEKDKARVTFATERYQRALHAVQAGVGMDIELGSQSATPKHLRTGINTALIDSGTLAGLLMKQGIITMADYFEALADMAEQEQRRYEETLSAATGIKVTLV